MPFRIDNRFLIAVLLIIVLVMTSYIGMSSYQGYMFSVGSGYYTAG